MALSQLSYGPERSNCSGRPSVFPSKGAGTCAVDEQVASNAEADGAGTVAAVHATGRPEGRNDPLMDENPQTRRRARLLATPATFIVSLLVLAAIVAAIIVVIYALGGFGEGSEGAFALAG